MCIRDRCKTWEPNTGRNAAGTTVGSIRCWKYKIERKWSFLTEAQVKSLRNLFENKPDYFAVKFDYDGEYKEITASVSYTHLAIILLRF